ncbi:MAG TPA: hypothetical protein VMW54_12570 [Terriglobia bacterium]|nr:hypothetical protein [Terriglobia bacterium]
MNSEFRFEPFYDPSVKPQWAQLSRLGGDRVTILFKELRASLGKIDGIVERLHFSGIKDGWVVRYSVGPCELFTARISPGLLEVKLPADFVGAGKPFKLPQPSAALKSAIPKVQSGEPTRIRLTNRARVRSFSNLAVARGRLFSKAG